jgi:hypothetical protein
MCDMIKNVYWYSRKVVLILVKTLTKFEFSLQVFEIYKISNFMKIRPVGAELFHADGQTDVQTDRQT